MPDTLAFQPKANSLFASQPLHAMRLETQSTSFPTSRSPAPDLAPASAKINPYPLDAAPSHSPHSSGPPEYGTGSITFPAALLPPYHASLLDNIARRHRFPHAPTTLGGFHCSNPGPSGRAPNWTFRSLHASPSTFSMTTDTAQPHPNQFMGGFACGDGLATGLENNGDPTVGPNAEEDDKVMKMGNPGTEKKKRNPQSKRMRVVQSCSECRRRKIKCDKKFPCSSCILRSDQARCHEVGMAKRERLASSSSYATTSQVALIIHRLDALEAALMKTGAVYPTEPRNTLQTIRSLEFNLGFSAHNLPNGQRMIMSPANDPIMGIDELVDDSECTEHLVFAGSR
ncbi:hypothetical protein EHS25_007203 [Saitozyma podzolica]|uniref:Zn(2)-C6 fungal-type domain-containing protein n=1 Tax=Saitozyma podzolica TaxID=1890683 RepID=A0A427XMY7_9TREE|nr:hypothetical protein EHS25_007203 [Saitozyma podzolica]